MLAAATDKGKTIEGHTTQRLGVHLRKGTTGYHDGFDMRTGDIEEDTEGHVCRGRVTQDRQTQPDTLIRRIALQILKIDRNFCTRHIQPRRGTFGAPGPELRREHIGGGVIASVSRRFIH